MIKIFVVLDAAVFKALAFHVAGLLLGREPTWNADEQVIVFAAARGLWLWQWLSVRKT